MQGPQDPVLLRPLTTEAHPTTTSGVQGLSGGGGLSVHLALTWPSDNWPAKVVQVPVPPCLRRDSGGMQADRKGPRKGCQCHGKVGRVCVWGGGALHRETSHLLTSQLELGAFSTWAKHRS